MKMIRLLAWHIKFEKRKALKKELNEKLIPIVWHPKRWWNFCLSEDEKKEVEPIFIVRLQKCASVVILKDFRTENCV